MLTNVRLFSINSLPECSFDRPFYFLMTFANFRKILVLSHLTFYERSSF